MINAEVSIKDNKYVAFSCAGHAGFSDKGKDIVCASVSALVINTANAIEKLSDCDFNAVASEDKITYVFKSEIDDKALLLMDALIIGLEGIQKEYGKKYLQLFKKNLGGN